MKRIILLMFLLILCAGCMSYKDSAIKEETAEVIQLSYIPELVSNVSGMSMGMDGNIGVVGGTSRQDEVWAVVLRCTAHRKTFALKSKDLYNRVKAGDMVTLKYYETIKYDKDNPGLEEVVDVHTKQIIFNDYSIIDRHKGE